MSTAEAVRDDLAIETLSGHVPTSLWRPRKVQPTGVVALLAHGGGGNKTSPRHERFASALAAEGISCLAIDGPFHGERRPIGDGPYDYQQRVVEEGPVRVHERMCTDWLTVVDAVADDGLIDATNLAFFGMSMGGRYGLLTCAMLGDRLRGAVFGKFGLQSTPEMSSMADNSVIRQAAQSISAPVLMHVQWDDEIFTRAGQFELFGLFASPDKQLRARPGKHAVTHPEDDHSWCSFLVDCLAKAS